MVVSLGVWLRDDGSRRRTQNPGETFMMETTLDPELCAYIAVLREALQELVDAIRRREKMPAPVLRTGLFSLDVYTAHAEGVLRMETGRHAYEELQIESGLVSNGYILADWCWHALYGTPRGTQTTVPTRAEVEEALAEIQRLTEASWALDALLAED